MEDRDLRVLQLLAQMYPSWRLSCRTDRHGQRWWWAIQRQQPSADLAAVGLYQAIARTSVDALSAALSNQARILHTRRVRRH
ncbi:hypothetical protein [Nonomuraea lactucae]|uniref:hypothetical protein n=1 Tax=Nonomuraea lactucae TaxID=2249762 RepID=UPI0013B3D270|nr:hypothetical protein [Nonomuraea lactucae]